MENHRSSIPFHIHHRSMKILWGCRALTILFTLEDDVKFLQQNGAAGL